jgi:hypothetical protein
VHVCKCRTSHFRQRHRFNEVCSPQTAGSFGRLRASGRMKPRQLKRRPELPEFLDLSPEEFALYFDAYEKRRAALLGLKPGEPVPPLNSKAGRRNQL